VRSPFFSHRRLPSRASVGSRPESRARPFGQLRLAASRAWPREWPGGRIRDGIVGVEGVRPEKSRTATRIAGSAAVRTPGAAVRCKGEVRARGSLLTGSLTNSGSRTASPPTKVASTPACRHCRTRYPASRKTPPKNRRVRPCVFQARDLGGEIPVPLRQRLFRHDPLRQLAPKRFRESTPVFGPIVHGPPRGAPSIATRQIRSDQALLVRSARRRGRRCRTPAPSRRWVGGRSGVTLRDARLVVYDRCPASDELEIEVAHHTPHALLNQALRG